ncbi:MAG: glycosyltransferase family 2 protein [bacterium]|nr:glycosyltransferase family 2 protein [bacterium]
MSQSSAPKVYISVLNYNGYRDTIECLESIFRQDYSNFQVIVCDNASSDGSLEHVMAWASGNEPFQTVDNKLGTLTKPPVIKPIHTKRLEAASTEASQAPLNLIPTGSNLGFAGGNNVALRWLIAQGDAEYVWILNNDVVVEPNALSELVARTQNKPGCGFCASAVCYYKEPETVQAYAGGYNRWLGLSWHLGELSQYDANVSADSLEREVAYAYGASTLVSSSVLEEVGLMNEEYFLYHEELDWALRAKGKFTIAVAPKARVYHKESQSIGNVEKRKSLLAESCFTRGRILLAWKFFPIALPLIYLSITYTLIKRMMSGQWRNLFVVVKAMLMPGAKVRVS